MEANSEARISTGRMCDEIQREEEICQLRKRERTSDLMSINTQDISGSARNKINQLLKFLKNKLRFLYSAYSTKRFTYDYV